ncbi:hypothetical protein FA10DRAFT_263410 [Acaromyces ingoldii]|uniref:LIM zinc-binding domain-containing protein n=1 Tax=Acaromyces ingoldii TaxID=215250 RepID=A0A316YX53_9BASI|nr:hypothetical protein FA10DRAFT_263410 [Acaromyces ingoldii]PWN92643.1 hypothetical protein FA10DRAFT_263410 [Acaromyces ingoldii]
MTTATATATTTAAAPKEKADRWARRYVAGLEASSYSPSSPSLSSPSLSPSKKGRLGFGVVPQSIARDLKTSNSSNVASAASGPIVQSHDGTLAKVYGTLLEPQEAREQQWRCAGCHASFPRDATLYLAPRRAGGTSGPGVGNGSGTGPGARAEAAAAPGEAFCRPCYEKRFALGRCPGCDGVVLGSTKEQGTFVKTSEGNLWHGKCWATCAHCGQVAATAAANDIVEGILDGLPTCMSCFDDGPRRAQSKTSTNTKTNTKTTPAAAAKVTNDQRRHPSPGHSPHSSRAPPLISADSSPRRAAAAAALAAPTLGSQGATRAADPSSVTAAPLPSSC